MGKSGEHKIASFTQKDHQNSQTGSFWAVGNFLLAHGNDVMKIQGRQCLRNAFLPEKKKKTLIRKRDATSQKLFFFCFFHILIANIEQLQNYRFMTKQK